MSNIPVVDGVYFTCQHKILIEAKTDTEICTGYVIRSDAKYSLLASTLDTGEEILGEIYDPSRTVWQPWYYQGSRVKLAHNQEQLFFDGVSSMVRFVKSETANPVGLTIFYL